MGQIWHGVSALASYLAERKRTQRCPETVVCTSGGFDPLHIGHVRYIQASARYGEVVVVIVNGDGFLMRKKGYIFMPLAERLEIIAAIGRVNHVVPWDDGTQFVDGALSLLRPNAFAKGGDRSTPESISEKERKICEDIGCEIAYGVGGYDKVQSSSLLAQLRQ